MQGDKGKIEGKIEEPRIFTNGEGWNFNHGLFGLTRMAEREVFALRMGREK